MSLDNRAVPISSHIQVKTLSEGSNRFQIRLSAAERLAKEIKPAFFYVFRLRGMEFVEARLIHIMDDVLAKILKRLREEQAAGRYSKANQKYLSFSIYEHSISIPPTGSGLRNAIEMACGKDFQGYIARKAEQIRGLGYEPRPYQGTFCFRGLQNEDEIIEFFLGLTKDVEAEILESTEVRFGIPIPLREIQGQKARVSISPNPIDTCTVVIRHKEFSSPMIFDADILVPALSLASNKNLKFLVKSQLFLMLISRNGTINFQMSEDLYSQRHSPKRWADLARLMVGLGAGEIAIEIRSKIRDTLSEFTIDQIDRGIDKFAWRRWLYVCEFAEDLFRRAAVSTDIRVRIEELEREAEHIVEAGALMMGKVDGICFSTDKVNTDLGNPVRSVFVDYFRIGHVGLAYYAVVEFAHEDINACTKWTASRITPGIVRMMPASVNRFQAFVEDATSKAGTDVSFVRRWPEETTDTP
jgi:hypothetical protein